MKLQTEKPKIGAVHVGFCELAPCAKSLRPRCRMMMVSVRTPLPYLFHGSLAPHWNVTDFILN